MPAPPGLPTEQAQPINTLHRKLVVCHEPRRHREDHGVEIVPVQEFMDALWAGESVE